MELNKNKIINVLKIPFIIAVVVFLYFAIKTNYASLSSYNFNPNWLFLFIGLFLWFISILISFMVWGKTMLAGVESSLGTLDILRISSLSYLAKYVPGKIWSPMTQIYLCEQAGIDKGKAGLSMLYDLAFNFITSLLFFGALIYPILFIPAIIGFFVFKHFDKVRKIPFIETILNFLFKIFRVPKIIPTNLHKMYLYMFLIQFVEGIAVYFMIKSIYPLSWSSMLFVAAVYEGAWAIGLLSFFTTAGLGVREGLMILMLPTVMPQHIAILGALVARVGIFFVELLTAGMMLSIAYLMKIKTKSTQVLL